MHAIHTICFACLCWLTFIHSCTEKYFYPALNPASHASDLGRYSFMTNISHILLLIDRQCFMFVLWEGVCVFVLDELQVRGSAGPLSVLAWRVVCSVWCRQTFHPEPTADSDWNMRLTVALCLPVCAPICLCLCLSVCVLQAAAFNSATGSQKLFSNDVEKGPTGQKLTFGT